MSMASNSPQARMMAPGSPVGSRVPQPPQGGVFSSGGRPMSPQGGVFASGGRPLQPLAGAPMSPAAMPQNPQSTTYSYKNINSSVSQEFVSSLKTWHRVRVGLLALGALGVVAFYYVVFHQPDGTTTTTKLDPYGAGAGEFDCAAGVANWESGWSPAKKEHCCKTAGRGCQTTTKPRFDCNAGFSNWQGGWSIMKKAWCCQHMGKGCPVMPTTTTIATPAPAFDCAAGFASWQSGWSDDKKRWCCQNQGKGCPASPPASDPYDCNAGFANWMSGWSTGKKVWCCHKQGKGCAGPQGR